MKNRHLSLLLVTLLLLLAGASCAGATVTVTRPAVTMPPVTMPGATVTLPGGVTTLPPVTVTLPGRTTTIAGGTITLAPITTALPPETVVTGLLLPATPSEITSHASIVFSLKGECLSCHGSNNYYEYPTAPFWDGGKQLSYKYPLGYYVVAGSIQDHTGRWPDGKPTVRAGVSLVRHFLVTLGAANQCHDAHIIT